MTTHLQSTLRTSRAWARRRGLRMLALVLVLGVCALVVPDSSVAPTRFVLVKVDHADGSAVGGGRIIRILAVGSDARPGEDMTRTRGDALQLISIDTKTHAASSIGIPRDSYVDIDGHGYDRINASLYYGGPQLLAKEVGELVGLQPDYVFVSRFKYFIAMVNDIGGIEVRNPVFFADDPLKPKGFPQGHIHLDGYGAMAFARTRHSLPAGDFDRSANQQRVIAGIQRRIAAGSDTPGFIARGVLDVMKYTSTDLAPAELFRLAQAVAQVDSRKITGCVVIGGFADINGASVVTPDTAMAKDYGNQVRKDAVIEHCDNGPAAR